MRPVFCSRMTIDAARLVLNAPLRGTPRSLTATLAPAFASARAMPRPIPRPAPVTNAVLPASMFMVAPEEGSLPGPDGLFEMVHAGRPAVHHDLAHLIDDGGGGRMDQSGEDRQLDHRPIALRDADERGDVRRVEIAERHQMQARYFVGIRLQLE